MLEQNADKPAILCVVQADLCIACGACVSACPFGTIESVYDRFRAAHEVRVKDAQYCVGCAMPCDSVCPSIFVEMRSLGGAVAVPVRQTSRERNEDPVWIGYSPAFQRNGVSSSGGIVRELIRSCIEQGMPVLCLTEKRGEFVKDFRFRYSPEILHDTNDIERLPGSIYHGVSFASALDLIKKADTRIALVTTPCQLEGISNYIHRIDPPLENKIGLVIGLICGWMYSDHSVLSFARFKNLAEPIQDSTYRGEDKIGKLTILSRGKKNSYSRREFATLKDFLDYRAAFSTELNRLRCRICENHTNLLADIAVGDAWLKRVGSEKVSVIISRSERGRSMVERLTNQGRVICHKGSYDDVIESQSRDLVRGENARAFSMFLAGKGVQVPDWGFAADDNSVSSVSVRTLYFSSELRRRDLVRRGRYESFRKWYAISRYRSIASFVVKKCLDRIGVVTK